MTLNLPNIIPLNATHANALAAIHSCCFETGWDEQAFQKLFQDLGTLGWGAYIEEKLQGFILARILYEQAEILTFCVLPEQQGQGIGSQLIQILQTHAKENGVKTIFLEVATSNQAALHLYNRLGFTKVNTRPNYYQSSKTSRVDALVLQFIC